MSDVKLSAETIYAYVFCISGCEASVALTGEQYGRQMQYPDATWRCPNCRGEASFDDDRFEKLHPEIYGDG
jgi:hypothetical protein